MPSFQIADCPTNLTTVESGEGAQRFRQGKLQLTVRNVSDRAQTARISIEAADGDAAWFAIEGAAPTALQFVERDFDGGATQTVAVAVKVPPDAAPRTYSFRVKVTAEADPDNDFTEGPAVSLVVPPLTVKPPARPFPWWAVAVAVLFVIIVIGAAVFFLRGDAPELVEVRGDAFEVARDKLVAAGFEAENITQQDGTVATGVAPGTVAEARVSGGGQEVTLVIDPGVEIVAPLGADVIPTAAALTTAGLVPTVLQVTADNVPFLRVETVTPPNGTFVALGATVNITTYVPGGGGSGGGSRFSVIESVILACPPFCFEAVDRFNIPDTFIAPQLPPGGIDILVDPAVRPLNPDVILPPAPP